MLERKKKMICVLIGCQILLAAGCGNSFLNGEMSDSMVQEEDFYIESMDLNTELASEEQLEDKQESGMVDVEAQNQQIAEIREAEAGTSVDVTGLDDRIQEMFYQEEIGEEVLSRINSVSYQENDVVKISDLRYLRCLYTDGTGITYVGEMIVSSRIADTVKDIFYQLYLQSYPIERMVLIDNFDGDDETSMLANNTSAFNYRRVAGSDTLSNHSYGLAIDLNPYYNPYVKVRSDGSRFIQPAEAETYADRAKEFPYKIDENDLAYQLFTQAGFTWGGSWNSVKDYQHFEYAN